MLPSPRPLRRSPELAVMTSERMIAPAEDYGRLFAAALPELPGARRGPVRAWREANFERFRRIGFPGPKSEAWKYTSVRPIVREAYALAPKTALARAAVAPFLLKEPKALRLVFVNGHFAADLSDDLSAVPDRAVQSLALALDAGAVTPAEVGLEADAERGFSALNGAFAGDGCLIRLADGASLDGPVQLLFVSLGQDNPLLISPRNVVVLGAGARLDLVESHVVLGGERSLTNLVNRILVGPGAELHHDRLQIGDVAGRLIGKNHYMVSADARLTQSLATLGGALVRNEIEAVLDGSGIALGLNGLYLTRERQHIDNAIQVEHVPPGQRQRSVLQRRARRPGAGGLRRPHRGPARGPEDQRLPDATTTCCCRRTPRSTPSPSSRSLPTTSNAPTARPRASWTSASCSICARAASIRPPRAAC